MAEKRESTLTVIVAFTANLAIAVAKSVAALITGSASMTAEAAHSWADTGNQVFLMVAERRSARPPDEGRPFGYGREAYLWSMFAALGLFVAGGAVSIYRGIVQLTAESVKTDFTIAYVVLAIAFCFEGISFAQAFRQTRGEAQDLGRDVLGHALATSDPTLRAVLAEDSAALLGLLIAAAGIGLHQWTGSPAYDAIGSIAVGVLLCGVALVLINRNHRFLAGQTADQELHDAVLERLRGLEEIDRVTYLWLEFLGPRQLLLIASVDLTGDEPEGRVAERLHELELELEEDPRIVEAVLTLAPPEDVRATDRSRVPPRRALAGDGPLRRPAAE